LAYWLTDLIKPLLTEGARVGLFSPINALIGLMMGWTIMGRGAGKTYRQSLGYGLTTLAATAFWSLVFWGGYEMVIRSTRLRYDGPVEALQDMAEIFLEYVQLVAIPEILWPALIGGIFVSWLTEFFARRWS
jgi:hypothetical protein